MHCPTHSSLLLISSSWDFASSHFFSMLSCQMLPTAQDSPCTKCPAARFAPQCCVFQLFPVNFNTCAKKTLIKLSLLAFVIRGKVIKNVLDTLACAHHLFLENCTEHTHTHACTCVSVHHSFSSKHPVETSGSLKVKSLQYLRCQSQVFSVYFNFYLSSKAQESHLLVLPKYVRRMP